MRAEIICLAHALVVFVLHAPASIRARLPARANDFVHSLNTCWLLQMEMRLAVAVLVSQMHVQLDHSKMAARTPADIIASVRSRLTMQLDGGVHLLMTPRAESV